MDYTILLIDYSPPSVEKLVNPLRSAGFHVEVAADASSGADTFRSLRPDLTLIQAMLPHKTGFELCRELKSTSLGQESTILLIASVYERRGRHGREIARSGSDGILDKPVRATALLETVCARLLGPDAKLPTAKGEGSQQGTAPAQESDSEAEISDQIDSLFSS